MDMGLQGRVVLVTGASSGIGRASSIAFAREGAKVALTYHSNREGGEKTAEIVGQSGGDSMVLPYDLGDEASIRGAVDSVLERWGAIDVLVNNAVAWAPYGSTGGWLFEDDPVDVWRTMVRSNVEGLYLTTQLVVPSMRSRSWGRIVNISSNLAEDARNGIPSYAAAKAGLHGLTRHLAWSLGSAGILTNVVMPGLTMTERANRPLPEHVFEDMKRRSCTGRITEPDEVAALILFLGSAANGHINGELIRVDGGM